MYEQKLGEQQQISEQQLSEQLHNIQIKLQQCNENVIKKYTAEKTWLKYTE